MAAGDDLGWNPAIGADTLPGMLLRHFAAFLLSLSGCAAAEPPPNRPALSAILKETKFMPRGNYTGADTPEDRQPLQDAVDSAIIDISSLPDPLDDGAVRSRLSALLDQTDFFATEDRDEVGRYAVRIWRAAGFTSDSGLYPVGDEQALAQP